MPLTPAGARPALDRRRQTDDGVFPARCKRGTRLAEVAPQLSRQQLSLAPDRFCVSHGCDLWRFSRFVSVTQQPAVWQRMPLTSGGLGVRGVCVKFALSLPKASHLGKSLENLARYRREIID